MKVSARHRARGYAVQALYSWQLSNNDIADIEAQFLLRHDVSNVDIVYFHELYIGSVTNAQELDEMIKPYLSRKLEEIDHVEHAVLRVALFELSKRQDIPHKVAINEAIELAKTFGAEDSYKFINSVLDKFAKKNFLIRK